MGRRKNCQARRGCRGSKWTKWGGNDGEPIIQKAYVEEVLNYEPLGAEMKRAKEAGDNQNATKFLLTGAQKGVKRMAEDREV